MTVTDTPPKNKDEFHEFSTLSKVPISIHGGGRDDMTGKSTGMWSEHRHKLHFWLGKRVFV